MYKKIEEVDQRINELNSEIQRLNDECAEKLSQISNASTSRIMSYGQEEEMNKIINHYTAILAKYIVELEELEEIKLLF